MASGTRFWAIEHRELQNAVAIGLCLSYGAAKLELGQTWPVYDTGWKFERIRLLEREGDIGRPMFDVRLSTPVPGTLELSGLEKIGNGNSINLRYEVNSIQLFAVLSTQHAPGQRWTFT